MKKLGYIVLFLFQLSGYSYAQNDVDSLLAKDNIMISLPSISVNFGFTHLMSDIALESQGPPAFTQFGYQLTISQRVAKFLNASIDLYTGTVFGEEQLGTTNLNFRTTLFSQHLNIEYNFFPLLKPNLKGRQLIRPYLGFGVGVLFFRSKGDLKDDTGIAYQYWADGSINAEIEGTVDPSEATAVVRDFEYETDLRDANLDGLRKYSQTAFSLPINAGIRFQITKNIGINAAFTYAMNFSDMLDNISSEGTGERKGEIGNDNHLFGSIGITVFLGRTKPSAKPDLLRNELVEHKKPMISENGNEDLVKEAEQMSEEGGTEDTDSEKETEEKSSVNELERLSELTIIQNKMYEDFSDSLKTISVELDSLTRKTNKLKSNFDESQKLSKSDRIELSKIIEKQKIISNQLEDIASKREIETENEQRKSILELKEMNHVLSGDWSANSKKLKRAKDTEDAKILISVIEQQSLNVNKGLVSVIQTGDKENQTESSMLIEKRLEIISPLQTDEKKLNDSALNVHLIKVINDLRILSEKTNSDKENIRILAEKLESIKSAQKDKKEPTTSLSSLELESSNKVSSSTATNGVEKTEMIDEQESAREVTLEAESTTDDKLNVNTSIEEIESAPPKISGNFHWADLNGNGMISPDEVLHFIDLLFEGEPDRGILDIQNLIDYYFDQE